MEQYDISPQPKQNETPMKEHCHKANFSNVMQLKQILTITDRINAFHCYMSGPLGLSKSFCVSV